MSFNPDLNKQAQEVIFLRKMTKSSHPQVFFNDIPVSRVSLSKAFRNLSRQETQF